MNGSYRILIMACVVGSVFAGCKKAESNSSSAKGMVPDLSQDLGNGQGTCVCAPEAPGSSRIMCSIPMDASGRVPGNTVVSGQGTLTKQMVCAISQNAGTIGGGGVGTPVQLSGVVYGRSGAQLGQTKVTLSVGANGVGKNPIGSGISNISLAMGQQAVSLGTALDANPVTGESSGGALYFSTNTNPPLVVVISYNPATGAVNRIEEIVDYSR